MAQEMIFTSESVTVGHPDKLCDQISDAAIDAFLRQDSDARAIVECAVATGVVFLAARFAADAIVDLPSLARGVIEDAGYRGPQFNARNCSVLTSIVEQPLGSRERPDDGDEAQFDRRVAHEQANVFGYACRETPELMPLPISLAHRVASALDQARSRSMHWLSPDAKTQVSVEYRGGRPRRIHSVSIIVALDPDMAGVDLQDRLRDLAFSTLDAGDVAPDAATNINVIAGEHYDIGGPARHAGLTGRKNGIDTYGEIARQSGAALSGKDPSRIDRTGTYAARHAAKNLVAAGLAERCEVHLAYAIGQATPLSVSVDTFGTGKRSDDILARSLVAELDFRPAAISSRFGLRRAPAAAGESGFYRRLATYGHFGRTDLVLPWEALDCIDALRG